MSKGFYQFFSIFAPDLSGNKCIKYRYTNDWIQLLDNGDFYNRNDVMDIIYS